MAQLFQTGDLPRRAVERYGLEIRAAEHRAVQAGAVMQQISLGDVTAHAVTEQHDGDARMLLANVLVETSQVANDFAPAIVIGEMAKRSIFGSFAMST
ncbi:hypothetical protein D3C80_1566950 [compost metagenome]